jgi:hypothetical protein
MTEAILFALMAVALLAVGAFFLRQGRSGFNSEWPYYAKDRYARSKPATSNLIEAAEKACQLGPAKVPRPWYSNKKRLGIRSPTA